jgi:hypothetical protein
MRGTSDKPAFAPTPELPFSFADRILAPRPWRVAAGAAALVVGLAGVTACFVSIWVARGWAASSSTSQLLIFAANNGIDILQRLGIALFGFALLTRGPVRSSIEQFARGDGETLPAFTR